MRIVFRGFLSFAAVFALPLCLLAQKKEHIDDIRPLLKSMTLDQKLNLLDYLRHKGADIDNEIQHAYERLAAPNQDHAAAYIDLMKKGVQQMPGTQVEWSRDTLLFGKIPEGKIVLDSFILQNSGREPYLISSTKTTCDCTVLQYPSYPVMPGETAVLRIQFDSQGKRGASTPAIIVYDNSLPNNRSILYLKGEVAPRKKLRKNPWED